MVSAKSTSSDARLRATNTSPIFARSAGHPSFGSRTRSSFPSISDSSLNSLRSVSIGRSLMASRATNASASHNCGVASSTCTFVI